MSSSREHQRNGNGNGGGNKPSASLYVRGVPEEARSEELREIFGKYGPVKDVYIPLDYYNRLPRGFAYIQYEDQRDAEDALAALNRFKLHSGRLEVEFAVGDRKTPNDMKGKERGGRGMRYSDRYSDRGGERSHRDRRSRTRSRSRGRGRSRERERSNRRRSRTPERRRDSRSPRRHRSRTRSRTPRRTRSRSPRRSSRYSPSRR